MTPVLPKTVVALNPTSLASTTGSGVVDCQGAHYFIVIVEVNTPTAVAPAAIGLSFGEASNGSGGTADTRFGTNQPGWTPPVPPASAGAQPYAIWGGRNTGQGRYMKFSVTTGATQTWSARVLLYDQNATPISASQLNALDAVGA